MSGYTRAASWMWEGDSSRVVAVWGAGPGAELGVFLQFRLFHSSFARQLVTDCLVLTAFTASFPLELSPHSMAVPA